jgi:hypothetical protein
VGLPRISKDEPKKQNHHVRRGVDQQMQPAGSEFFQYSHLRSLVSLHDLLWELWNRQLGEQTILWNRMRYLRLAQRETIIHQSISGARATLLIHLMPQKIPLAHQIHMVV